MNVGWCGWIVVATHQLILTGIRHSTPSTHAINPANLQAYLSARARSEPAQSVRPAGPREVTLTGSSLLQTAT